MKTSNRPDIGLCATASPSLILNLSGQVDSGPWARVLAVSIAIENKPQKISFRKIMFLLIGVLVLVKEPRRVGDSVGTID